MDARRVTARALEQLDLPPFDGPVRIVAAGKAAVGMAMAVDHYFGPSRHAGALMTAEVAAGAVPGWRAIGGTHPTPGAASEAAGRAALQLADETAAEDGWLLVCLSGGASAMMAVPVEGVSMAEKAETTRALLGAGLDISEVNTVRRALSAIKGGQLAARAGRTVTLAISDVCTPVEDDPLVIGSGPTVGDPGAPDRALVVVRDAGLLGALPPAVVRALERRAGGEGRQPVRPDDPRLAASAYWVMASRQDAMRAAAETARRLGYHTVAQASAVMGEARSAASALVARAAAESRPACVVASGETVVHVRGRGLGGRNQECALGALEPLAALGDAAMACIGTDGRDGPTDAAGAFVDATMWADLGGAGHAPQIRDAALDANDSYPLLDRLGALIRTGPTGTNVGDVSIVIVR